MKLQITRSLICSKKNTSINIVFMLIIGITSAIYSQAQTIDPQSSAQNVEAQTINTENNHPEVIHDEAFAKIGQWIKRGDPLKEAPICYQLWKCSAAIVESSSKTNIPEGTWGLCENFLVIDKNIEACNICNAPTPQAACQ